AALDGLAADLRTALGDPAAIKLAADQCLADAAGPLLFGPDDSSRLADFLAKESAAQAAIINSLPTNDE
ncbi:MAG: hypothetical protein LBE01_04945, partial [Deltaproteobacteria bacterium]|nr:hypothetical protein [Deltaproteobacteria bacterium]